MSQRTDSPVRNGVDTATLFATLDAVRTTPEIAKFQFRARNTWVSGTHSRTTIHDFHGAMQEMAHAAAHTYDADHPRCWSAATTHPRRSSSSCTRWPPA
jgi:hypothetical protein